MLTRTGAIAAIGAILLAGCALEDEETAHGAERARSGVRRAAILASEGVRSGRGGEPSDIPEVGSPVDRGGHGSVPAPADEERELPPWNPRRR